MCTTQDKGIVLIVIFRDILNLKRIISAPITALLGNLQDWGFRGDFYPLRRLHI